MSACVNACAFMYTIYLPVDLPTTEGDSWSHWLVLGHSVFKNIRFGGRND